MRMLTIALLVTGQAVGLAGCGDNDSTEPNTDTVLESVSPSPGATGVDPSAPITIRFSGPMASGMEQYVDVHQGGIDGPVVPMTCAFSPDRTTLTCTHDQPLQSGTSYTIHMGSGMMDGSGHPVEVASHGMAMGGQPVTGQMMGGMHDGQPTGMMGQGWQDGDGHLGMAFTFQASAGGQQSGATALESVSPAAGAMGVDPSAPITVQFSGPMASGMEQYVDLHQGGIDGPVVPMTCSLSADRTTITCTHSQPLEHGTTYAIHMGSGMMDENGHPAEIESHGMAMGGQPVSGQMMGGMHNGQPTGMMGQGWQDGDGHLGMAFTFQTS